MRIFLIIAVLLLGAGYGGYVALGHFLYAHNVEKCVEKTQTNGFYRGDVTPLCECSLDFVKDDPFFDKEDPEVKKKMQLQHFSCAKLHLRDNGTDQCDTMKEGLKKRTGQDLDCVCMNQKMLNIVMKQWEENGEINKGQLGAVPVLKMVRECLK